MIFIIIIVIIILIISCIFAYTKYKKNQNKQNIIINKRKYSVDKSKNNFIDTGILLNKLFDKSKYLVDNIPIDDTDFILLKNRINNIELNENIRTNDVDNVSYTNNKQYIYLCLRDENNNFYNEDILFYILIHELTHVGTDELNTEHKHSENFYRIMQKLLVYAKKYLNYDVSNSNNVKEYCGRFINTKIN